MPPGRTPYTFSSSESRALEAITHSACGPSLMIVAASFLRCVPLSLLHQRLHVAIARNKCPLFTVPAQQPAEIPPLHRSIRAGINNGLYMPEVPQPRIEMRAPEKRHAIVGGCLSHDDSCDMLPLTLSMHPMLHPDPLPA